MSKLIYAGIGSRETPHEVIDKMYFIGQYMANKWILRSGHADGADRAFENGARKGNGSMEIFLPWFGFNGAGIGPSYVVPVLFEDMLKLAARHHPAWHACSQGAQKMHARNCCQILGLNLDKPANLVICWTKGGLGGGGTGQALRLAKAQNIPIFDLAIKGKLEELADFVLAQEQKL